MKLRKCNLYFKKYTLIFLKCIIFAFLRENFSYSLIIILLYLKHHIFFQSQILEYRVDYRHKLENSRLMYLDQIMRLNGKYEIS